MTRQEKVDLAWSFWEHWNQRRMDEAFNLLHPEGTYRPNCIQMWDDVPFSSGVIQDFIRKTAEQTPIRFTLQDTIVEDNNVVLEFTAFFEIPEGGGLYDQRYCMIMTLQGDKILRIREFLDTEMELGLMRYIAPDVFNVEPRYGRGGKANQAVNT